MSAGGGEFDLMEHLPALQVAVPMLGSVLAALVRRGALAWIVAMAVAWSMPAISGLILHEVQAHGTISYVMGGWSPPEIGIEYRIDEANAYLLCLVSLIAALVTTAAPSSIAREIPARRQGWYYSMFLICLCGLQGMVITGDAFNIFVFMEISSLATYVLIAMGRDRRALVSAYQYLVIGTTGATFYVIGVGLLFTMTGTLNLVEIARALEPLEASDMRPVHAALVFIAVGLSLKLALFPLHLWLPNAYAFAPSIATVFLASTATKVAVYLLARFIFSVFGLDFAFAGTVGASVVLLLACIAMVGPSLVAVFQANVKRMLAYSSVAQIGYIVLGIAMLSEAGLTGGISHLFNHAVIKACLFLAVACVVYSTGITKIEQMSGLGRTMPLTMSAFVIGGLGLIGVPGTAGFVSKWFLIQAAVEQQLWWLVAVIVLASVIAVVYVGRVVEIAWFRAPEGPSAAPGRVPVELLSITWALAGATIYFGLQTDISLDVAQDAARVLLEGYAHAK